MADNEEKELLKKARKGNVEAMFELANLYSFEGRNDEAQKWYKKASKRGHSGAKKSKKGFRLPRRSLENIREWTIFILTVVLIVAAVVFLCILFPWFLEIIKWLGAIICVIIFFIILVMIFG
jgi:TPR repeat protein